MIAVLALAASLGGLILKGLYLDNAFVTTTWLGNDAITLVLAVPILVIAMLLARRGSRRAYLIWMGALDYMLYNYAFYLFGSTFNAFFLIYATLVGLSIFALIFGLAGLDASHIRAQFAERTPVRLIGGYFLFVALGLGLVYLAQSIGFIATGQAPDIIERSGHITNVVFALDLTMVIPWMVVAAVWLFNHKPWGYVIAGILSVKGPLYTLVLSVNSLLVYNRGITQSFDVPLWGTLTVLGLAAGTLLYGNMKAVASEQAKSYAVSQ